MYCKGQVFSCNRDTGEISPISLVAKKCLSVLLPTISGGVNLVPRALCLFDMTDGDKSHRLSYKKDKELWGRG